MKAFVLIKTGTPEEAFDLQDIPEPVAGEYEVLIKTSHFGLNFADVMARKGLYGDAPPRPFVPGYDVSGVVETVGKKVNPEWIGKKVTALTRFGGYAEYAKAHHLAIAEISDIEPGMATALATQYCTAYYAACVATYPFPGSTWLIHSAAGGVGSALVQLGLWKNIRLIGTCSTEKKAAHLREKGVHLVVNHRETEWEKKVMDFTAGKRVDTIFDAIGGPVTRKSRGLLSYGGSYVFYGAAVRSKRRWIFDDISLLRNFGLFSPVGIMMKSQGMIGVNMLRLADHKPHILGHCMKEVVELVHKGHITLHEGNAFPAKELAAAHRLLESGQSEGKIYCSW